MKLPKARKFYSQIKTKAGIYEIQIWGKSHNNEKQRAIESEWEMLQKANPTKKVAFLEQEHKDKILCFEKETNSIFLGQADAIYTTKQNFLCTVRSADCVPILGFCESKPLCLAIHAGWRGLFLGIIPKVLENFKEEIKNFCFFIGPHIHYQNYEVGEDVYSKFAESFYEQKGNKALLNLTLIALNELYKSGVQEFQVSLLFTDTFQSGDFFSHRAGETGRNLNSICYLGPI